MAKNAWKGKSYGKKEEKKFVLQDRVRVVVGIEQALVNADSFCMETRKLLTHLMKQEDLRELMFNVSEVQSIIEDMIEEGKLDKDAYYELGILSLTPPYFEQFQDPQKMRRLGENEHYVISRSPDPSPSSKSNYHSS